MPVNARLLAAMNSRNPDAFAACFAEDYRSEQPAHPGRAFSGSDQVLKNWTAVFAGVPTFQAELVLEATLEGVEIGEWRWYGEHTDGSHFEMRGVTVLGVEDELIAWGRLYMEPLEVEDEDIDQMVRTTYQPPQ
jgi:hypothetical protein